jgi:hypothetical protein
LNVSRRVLLKYRAQIDRVAPYQGNDQIDRGALGQPILAHELAQGLSHPLAGDRGVASTVFSTVE